MARPCSPHRDPWAACRAGPAGVRLGRQLPPLDDRRDHARGRTHLRDAVTRRSAPRWSGPGGRRTTARIMSAAPSVTGATTRTSLRCRWPTCASGVTTSRRSTAATSPRRPRVPAAWSATRRTSTGCRGRSRGSRVGCRLRTWSRARRLPRCLGRDRCRGGHRRGVAGGGAGRAAGLRAQPVHPQSLVRHSRATAGTRSKPWVSSRARPAAPRTRTLRLGWRGPAPA